MIHAWSNRIAEYIGRELIIDEKKKAIVAYGVEVIIGATIKLLVFIAIPLFLGILKEFLVVYLSFAFLRLAAGGVHCSAYYRCLLFTLISYLLISYAAIYFSNLPLPYQEIYWGILVLAFIVMLAKAPVDVEEKPIISPVRRKKLKAASCYVVVVYFGLSIYWDPGNVIYIASGLSVLLQLFTLTQSGNRFFRWLDRKI